jgi:NAD(P)-dependent dehydrogenase (short-subunit alcohol dehydrogenase family)
VRVRDESFPTSTGEKSRLARASSRVGQRVWGIGCFTRLTSSFLFRLASPFALERSGRRGHTLPMAPTHVALVTGGGRGIGAAVARALGERGACVFVAARSQDDCFGVAEEVREAGGTAWPLLLDVTDPESIAEALEAAADAAADFGPIDWLVNNAGIAVSAPFLEHGRATGTDLYEQHLAVNFHGPRRLVEALAPGMLERGYGRIVNMASSAGLNGYGYVAAYCASKHALVGYSRAVAHELGKGVTLNVVCPHYVDSPMTDASIEKIVAKTGRSPEQMRAFFAEQNPGGVLVTEEEVAASVRDLCLGDEHGQLVELAGGSSRRSIDMTVPNHPPEES